MDKKQALHVAKEIIKKEQQINALTKSVPAFIIHKGNTFLAATQSLFHDDPEIVLCAHTSFPIEQILIDAFNELSTRTTLTVDDDLTLAHRQDILRLTENRLTSLTPEQINKTKDFLKDKNIIEI